MVQYRKSIPLLLELCRVPGTSRKASNLREANRPSNTAQALSDKRNRTKMARKARAKTDSQRANAERLVVKRMLSSYRKRTSKQRVFVILRPWVQCFEARDLFTRLQELIMVSDTTYVRSDRNTIILCLFMTFSDNIILDKAADVGCHKANVLTLCTRSFSRLKLSTARTFILRVYVFDYVMYYLFEGKICIYNLKDGIFIRLFCYYYNVNIL